MVKNKQTNRPKIPWDAISVAAGSATRVTEYTHNLYRYPAMMAPKIARTIIGALSEPGDYILDPFCGGGTTAVEAIAQGRNAICGDINPLACFITKVKAMPLNIHEINLFSEWLSRAREKLMRAKVTNIRPLKTVRGTEYAPITNTKILNLRDYALTVERRSVRRIALLLILRVAQLSFDCKKSRPTPFKLVEHFDKCAKKFEESIIGYSNLAEDHKKGMGEYPKVLVLRKSAKDILGTRRKPALPKPSLVLASPPYPGVHILYNRWQVYGRKETTLPYELLNLRDGRPESAFLMGSRKDKKNQEYFCALRDNYEGIRAGIDKGTLLVQTVAFPNFKMQLRNFLSIMAAAGFEPIYNNDSRGKFITRKIPNRKWYADINGNGSCGKEYVFIHEAV